MKIGFLPIDNRPVCYTLPRQIAQIDGSAELFIPERKLLGDLTKYADVQGIFDWLENLPPVDALIIPLDTAAYGGLISSRRCPETFEEIKTRIERLKEILEKKNARIYAFSSIMRISNNNINEEEKEYWNRWGKKIFDYSYQTHKNGQESCIANIIPSDILDDYLATRRRNFEINKIYLEWQKGGLFDTLIFSKDDCAEYGFNVQEAQTLEKLGGFVKTGADEIPLTLLAKALSGDISISPVFSEPDEKDLISNYEDVSIEKSVQGQLELAGCKIAEEGDIRLFVNNFRTAQGEIVMKRPTEPFTGNWVRPEGNYMIADVRFANGADNAFVEKFMEAGTGENFYGYSAWNTSANSFGSLICAAKFKFLAKKYNDIAFKRLQAVRLLDDWAYQANVRQMLSSPDTEKITELMKPYEKRVAEFLGIDIRAKYSFPWNRLFEVEIELI